MNKEILNRLKELSLKEISLTNLCEELNLNDKIKHVLSYYKNYRAEIADPKSNLYKLKKEFEEQTKQ